MVYFNRFLLSCSVNFFLFEYCSCVPEQQSKDLVFYSILYFQYLKEQYMMNSLEFNKGNQNLLCKTLVISQKSYHRLYVAYKTKPMITINYNIIM